ARGTAVGTRSEPALEFHLGGSAVSRPADYACPHTGPGSRQGISSANTYHCLCFTHHSNTTAGKSGSRVHCAGESAAAGSDRVAGIVGDPPRSFSPASSGSASVPSVYTELAALTAKRGGGYCIAASFDR